MSESNESLLERSRKARLVNPSAIAEMEARELERKMRARRRPPKMPEPKPPTSRPRAKRFSDEMTKETPTERSWREFSTTTAITAIILFLLFVVTKHPVVFILAMVLGLVSFVAYNSTREARWNRVRRHVYRRSGHACEKCGMTGVRLVAHHNIPRAAGGKDSVENLVCLCEKCHAEIHPWLKA